MLENIIPISATGIFYSLDGAIVLAASLRVWQHFREKRNAMARNFSVLFLVVALDFFLNGLPVLLAPKNLFLIKVSFIVGLLPMFLGFAFAIRPFLNLTFSKLAQNIGSILTLVFGATIIILNIFVFKLPQVGLGSINWEMENVSHYIYSFLILAVTIPVAAAFCRYSFKSWKLAKRGLLFATTFSLIGMAAVGTISDSSLWFLLLSQSVMALGFILGGIVFVLYRAFETQI